MMSAVVNALPATVVGLGEPRLHLPERQVEPRVSLRAALDCRAQVEPAQDHVASGGRCSVPLAKWNQ